jgi:hypothetical protein
MIKLIAKKTGSIALISILVVCAILLVLVIGTSDSQLSTSYQQLNSISNKTSYYISEACLEEVMVKIKNDASYAGGTIAVGEDGACIVQVSGSSIKTISIIATFGDYTQNYEAEVSVITDGTANNVRLLNWQKI